MCSEDADFETEQCKRGGHMSTSGKVICVKNLTAVGLLLCPSSLPHHSRFFLKCVSSLCFKVTYGGRCKA